MLRLTLNPLGLQKISCLLQFLNHFFDFRNRCGSEFLNKWRNLHVNFGLGVEGASA